MFKIEVNHLVDIGTLKLTNNSKWVAPSFSQNKPKIRRVLLLIVFRSLNRKVKYKPHPMLKMQEIITKPECF